MESSGGGFWSVDQSVEEEEGGEKTCMGSLRTFWFLVPTFFSRNHCTLTCVIFDKTPEHSAFFEFILVLIKRNRCGIWSKRGRNREEEENTSVVRKTFRGSPSHSCRCRTILLRKRRQEHVTILTLFVNRRNRCGLLIMEEAKHVFSGGGKCVARILKSLTHSYNADL
jgi:hypothetical protein